MPGRFQFQRPRQAEFDTNHEVPYRVPRVRIHGVAINAVSAWSKFSLVRSTRSINLSNSSTSSVRNSGRHSEIVAPEG